jgi:DnaK suppressor protein
MNNIFFNKVLNFFSKSEIINDSKKSIISNPLWTEYEIQNFLDILQTEKLITCSEIDSLNERIVDINEYTSSGKVESYNSEYNTFENERITSSIELERLQKYLNEINKALKRISNGTYGICVKCKCKINKERLLAVPTTTQSASWKIQGHCPSDGIDVIKHRNNNG